MNRRNRRTRPFHGIPVAGTKPLYAIPVAATRPIERLREDILQLGKIQTLQEARIEDCYVTPEDLYDISLKGLPRDVMEHYIRVAYRQQCPSPSFVEGVLLSLPGYSNTFDYFGGPEIPEGRVLEHNPGVNDTMSGALTPRDRPLRIPVNDALDCADNVDDLVHYMPRCVISARDVAGIPGIFEDPHRCLSILGPEYLTTYAGLRRAIEQRQNIIPRIDDDLDDLTMGTLTIRGGRLTDDVARRRVVYPEDMSPFIGEEHRYYDELYWTELKALAKSWASHW